MTQTAPPTDNETDPAGQEGPRVIFTPSGRRGHVAPGTTVLDAARALGVDLDSVCGGRGICARCQVTPSFGAFPKHGVTVTTDALSPWNAVEERYRSKRGLAQGRRLGCQARIMDDVVIDVPAESQVHKQVVRKRAELRAITMAPPIRLHYVEVARPDMHDPSGDLERLKKALGSQWGIADPEADFAILADLQQILRKGDWKVTVAVHMGDSRRPGQIIRLWPGFFEGPVYGMAIDLGSTTIAAHLCDMQSGEVVESNGVMNPQIRFGEDLMSRVSYAMMNQGGAAEMTRAVREGLNGLCAGMLKQAGIDADLVLEAVIVCNPVMHHLLLGIDPYELGQAPFALATADALNLCAGQLELSAISQAARIHILPCIAGHVGADAAAVALSEAPHKSDELMLVVDVGTNAEIMLGNRDRLLACSSPTGPAFEGAQISSGQRAAPGAIERVRIDPASKEPRFKVIGCDLWSDEPGFAEATAATGITGICGSGIIEMVAEMRLAGLVDASGLIGSAEQTGSRRCIVNGRTHEYLVWDDSATGGARITVTNRDIREIQMAKAALYSGARLLMDRFGTDHVDSIRLAGAFGAHISPLHAMILGMIPDCPLERVSSAGNAAGTGARIALLNIDARLEIAELVRRIDKVETAIEPRFQEHFVNASAIPNAVEPFPILRGIVDLPDVSFNSGKDGPAGRGQRRRRRGQG